MLLRKVYYLILTIIAILVVAGCGNSHIHDQLVEVENLIEEDHLDSADVILVEMQVDFDGSREDSAYLGLLETRLHYLQYRPSVDDGKIDYSIAYYKKVDNKEKLANSCYYKGASLFDLHDYKRAVVALKEAEHVADFLDDAELKHKIYETLTLVNEQCEEYNIAREYALKNLELGNKAHNYNWIVYAMGNLAVEYHEMQQSDSAISYLHRVVPLLEYVPQKDRAYFLADLGMLYAESNKTIAVDYLTKSLEIKPLPSTYNALARITFNAGDHAKADEYWDKGIKIATSQEKLDILSCRSFCYASIGDYKQAYTLSDSILVVNNEVVKNSQNGDVKNMQMKFDYEMQIVAYKEKIAVFVFVIVLLAVLCGAIVLLLTNRKVLRKLQILKSDAIVRSIDGPGNISEKSSSLPPSEKSEVSSKVETEQNTEGKTELDSKQKAKQKVLEMDDRDRDIVYRGLQKYEELKAGGTLVRWTQDDYFYFLQYYMLINEQMHQLLEDGIGKTMSPRLKVCFILMANKKSEEEIGRIMGIEVSSVRSQKSRVKKTMGDDIMNSIL